MFCQSQTALQAKVQQHPLPVQRQLRLGRRLNKPLRRNKIGIRGTLTLYLLRIKGQKIFQIFLMAITIKQPSLCNLLYSTSGNADESQHSQYYLFSVLQSTSAVT